MEVILVFLKFFRIIEFVLFFLISNREIYYKIKFFLFIIIYYFMLI